MTSLGLITLESTLSDLPNSVTDSKPGRFNTSIPLRDSLDAVRTAAEQALFECIVEITIREKSKYVTHRIRRSTQLESKLIKRFVVA